MVCKFTIGTGDAAKINTNADFGFGTGDFIIDWVIYRTTINSIV